MGCSSSKVDDQEEVKICLDRKNFTKQAIVQRNRFASWHILYLQSLLRVSFALCNYIDEYEHHRFLYPYRHLPSIPAKIFISDITMIPPKSFASLINQCERSTSLTVSYLRSGGNPTVAKEEWSQSPETMRVESYYPTNHPEIGGFFPTDVSTINPPLFSSYNGSNYLQASPEASNWDLFWNPFSSADGCGYPSISSRSIIDDETEGIGQAREEEKILELEDEEDEENHEVETVKKEELDTNKKRTKSTEPAEVDKKMGTMKEVHDLQSHIEKCSNRSEEQKKLQINNDWRTVGNATVEQGTPGFTVYANRRPTSMGEVMKDLETQFARICDSASEVSVLLEVSKAEEFAVLPRVRMPNPAAFFHSSSTRFFQASTTRRNDGNEGSTDNLEESLFKSHKATLDRLHEWEKKLYEEIKSGERVRQAYEKKCTQLKNHDLNGAEPSAVNKTRAAIRDLKTQLRISISSVKYISKRIETLRDEELYPQLVELIQGLARMWRAMAESHRIQKRTIDEAKLLLFSTSFSAANFARNLVAPPPPRPSSRAAASAVESELRNMRDALANWIGSQRAYATALAGWIRSFTPPSSHDGEAAPTREEGGGAAPPVYETCVQWARVLESVEEKAAIEGLEFFAAGMAAVVAGRSRRRREAAEVEVEEEEDGERVVCAGTAVVVGALEELAGEMAEGYEGLVRGLEESGREEEQEEEEGEGDG